MIIEYSNHGLYQCAPLVPMVSTEHRDPWQVPFQVSESTLRLRMLCRLGFVEVTERKHHLHAQSNNRFSFLYLFFILHILSFYVPLKCSVISGFFEIWFSSCSQHMYLTWLSQNFFQRYLSKQEQLIRTGNPLDREPNTPHLQILHLSLSGTWPNLSNEKFLCNRYTMINITWYYYIIK